MKYLAFLALIAVQAVQLEYNEFNKPAPPIWTVVKRGDSRDFADDNVKKAMELNPTSGSYPIAPAPKEPIKPDTTEPWGKQPWEFVVKKGNSKFSDGQVAKAQALKKEVIAINGKVVPAGGEAGDPERAGDAALKASLYAKEVAQSLVPEEGARAGEKVLPAFPATVIPAEAAPAAKKAAPAAAPAAAV